MKGLNENTWNNMLQFPSNTWTKYAYNTNVRCDLQANNIYKEFNKVKLEYEDKHIITML